MEQEKNFIAKKISQAMADAEMTQQELARVIKTDRGLISAWKTGKRVPTIKSIEKIALATKKSLNFFLSEEAADSNENLNNYDNIRSLKMELETIKKELNLKDQLTKILESKVKFLENKIKVLESRLKDK